MLQPEQRLGRSGRIGASWKRVTGELVNWTACIMMVSLESGLVCEFSGLFSITAGMETVSAM
jgi:hypothetical protein